MSVPSFPELSTQPKSSCYGTALVASLQHQNHSTEATLALGKCGAKTSQACLWWLGCFLQNDNKKYVQSFARASWFLDMPVASLECFCESFGTKDVQSFVMHHPFHGSKGFQTGLWASQKSSLFDTVDHHSFSCWGLRCWSVHPARPLPRAFWRVTCSDLCIFKMTWIVSPNGKAPTPITSHLLRFSST